MLFQALKGVTWGAQVIFSLRHTHFCDLKNYNCQSSWATDCNADWILFIILWLKNSCSAVLNCNPGAHRILPTLRLTTFAFLWPMLMTALKPCGSYSTWTKLSEIPTIQMPYLSIG